MPTAKDEILAQAETIKAAAAKVKAAKKDAPEASGKGVAMPQDKLPDNLRAQAYVEAEKARKKAQKNA